jgi:transcriptional regulator with XRE-family HTH domain
VIGTKVGDQVGNVVQGTEAMAEIDPKQVGERIAFARKAAGLGQAEFASAIGVALRSVQNYESGRVPWKLLQKIADETSVEKDWILYGDAEVSSVIDGEAADGIQDRLATVEDLLREILRRLDK